MPKEHKEHATHYKHIKIKKLPHSEVEIEGEIEAAEFDAARGKAVKYLSEHADIAGFRKGHIPESVLVSKLGENAILEEAAEIVLGHEYGHIVVDYKIDVIGRPQIALTKVAKGNDLGFKIKVAVFPEITMPDYKKVAAKEMAIKEEIKEVTDEDTEKVVAEILKTYPKEPGQEKEHELTDAFVQGLGDFNDVADFRKKLRGNIAEERKSRGAEKKRLAISDTLVANTKIDLPETLVENELNRMGLQFRDDLAQMNVKFEDYIKSLKKTEEDLRKEWRKDAEKRVTLQIVLNKIGIAEKLEPTKEAVEKEASHMMEHYKEADPERIRNYVETMLVNEQVYKFLESQK